MESPKMSSKIKVKVGGVEVEYEGSEAFLKEELPGLLSTLAKLQKEFGSTPTLETEIPRENGEARVAPVFGQATTGTIAAKLGVKSGPELIVAACARLIFVLGKDSFTRKEILQEMQSAAGYYKYTHVNNLTKYQRNLV